MATSDIGSFPYISWGFFQEEHKKLLGNVWEKVELNSFLFESGQYIVTCF